MREFLRFWLTLIVSTIVISAALTWLVMYQGAQALPSIPPPAAATDPPEIVLEGVTMMANVIQIKAPDCHVGKTSAISVPFKNVGKGPLKIQLVRTSCGCVHDVKVNDTKLESDKGPIGIPPGGAGAINFSWAPKAEQLSNPRLVISADLLINDPRPQFASQVRLEITSMLKD